MFKVTRLFNLAWILPSLYGCTASSSIPSSSTSSTSAPVTTYASPGPGARAVRIIFQQASPGGSFDAPPSAGTPAAAGSGLQATRIFNADGSLLSSSTTSSSTTTKGTNWPAWFISFEMGISGPNNASAQNPDCANFASSTEATLTNCTIGSPSSLTNCGAPQSQFRVSEADCSIASNGAPATLPGTGGASDGVYFRVHFDRTQLGAYENLLAVLEFSSSSLNPAPSNPTNCLLGGRILPENCSDFVWRAYLRHNMSEVVQPYFLIVPPFFSAVLGTNQQSGTNVATKQFIIPLSSDSNLSYLQITRTGSNFPAPAQSLKDSCTNGGSFPADSPLCVGMVFYSLTLYRI